MTRRRLILLATLWFVLAGVAGIEARLVFRQREEITASRKRQTQHQAELASLQREHDSLARELAHAQRQLAALPEPAQTTLHLSSSRIAELNAWLTRTKQLRSLFADHPDQRIPELALLTDDDWLRLAKKFRFDSPDAVRKAAAEARGTAIARFAAQIRFALRAYGSSGKIEKPDSILALAAHFNPPVDLAMLERYEIAPSPPPRSTRQDSSLVSASAGHGWLVRNKTAIDPGYDWRYEVSRDGGTSSTFGPWAWEPDLRERHRRASQAYMQANQGITPARLADVLPFFHPPLAPTLAEDMLKAYETPRE